MVHHDVLVLSGRVFSWVSKVVSSTELGPVEEMNSENAVSDQTEVMALGEMVCLNLTME